MDSGWTQLAYFRSMSPEPDVVAGTNAGGRYGTPAPVSESRLSI